ncbi:putative oxidoreductase [uncultured Pleomorphomonas sp.]|uniref:Probable oxidoreductase n=1 Tax=uncultured Pleomorphomonas sp. TaxID=442121 RepID=A0A212L7J3_9HYPH|nr:SDR family NAD(P)-dependent oxidoreductase [uncultured Pleomorphomonas sp.]SCM73521.1 putative oxidoreductase [uncultured Pleomorphomonas sp.]
MQISQHPVGSGFNAASTTGDVLDGIDLSGRTAVVTGGYSGLGLETVRSLAAAGARVIVPARDVERARRAMAAVDAEVWPMDLLSPASIDAFAERFLARASSLDLLVNNAGIMALPALTLDERGYEYQFATNHLGHFQLTLGLLPALRRAGDARVVSLTSLGHRYSPVHFEDVNFAHRQYGPWLAYGQSKTANILFTVGLDARERSGGVCAFAVHPGSIAGTGLEKHIPMQMLIDAGVLDSQGRPIVDPSRNLKTVAQGTATTVWCATSPRLAGLGGVYCENCDIAPISTFQPGSTTMEDAMRISGVMPYAVDAASADRLWALSEEMIEER